MKRMLLYNLLASLLVLLAACSQTQAPLPEAEIIPQGKEGYNFRGEGLSAYFYKYDECSETSISVFATDGRVRSGQGGADKISQVDLYVGYWNWCEAWGTWSYGSATLEKKDFNININRGLATLSKEVEVFGYDWWSDTYGLVGVVQLDLVWTATSDLVRTRDTYRYDEPGHKYRYSFRGAYRDATVSGIASLEGDNLIDSLSQYGQIMQAQVGEMIIVQEQRLPPRISSFEAEPKVILAGQSTTLSWEVSSKQRTTLTIEGVGDVTGHNSITVSPTATTTYILTATNRNGTSSAWATVWVIAPDAYELNNGPEDAARIEPNFYSPELTILPGDVDWFTFSLNEATEVSAFLNTWTFDPLMSLFDEELNEIASGTWMYTWLEAGTYYLAVSGYPDFGFIGDHEQAGLYELSISAWAPPPPPVGSDVFEPNDNPTPGEATTIMLNFYSPKLTITASDVDWFTFTLTEAATIIADIDATVVGSFLDSIMGLFDDELVQLAINDDSCDDNGCTLDSYLEVYLEPGTYYLAVSGFADFNFSGEHLQQGFYYLSVTAMP